MIDTLWIGAAIGLLAGMLATVAVALSLPPSKHSSHSYSVQDSIAAFKRWRLIRSAKRKVREDGNAYGLTSDEWNALAYEPLQAVRKSVRENCPMRKGGPHG